MRIPVLSLLYVILVWGATFPVLKIAMAQLSGIEKLIRAFPDYSAAMCLVAGDFTAEILWGIT